jgi:hypothetical protein
LRNEVSLPGRLLNSASGGRTGKNLASFQHAVPLVWKLPDRRRLRCEARSRRNINTDFQVRQLSRANAEINFRNGGSAEGSGEHTRPRVWCSASRRTGFSGGTPEIARGDACAPQPLAAPTLSQAVPLEHLEGGPGAMAIWKFLSAFALNADYSHLAARLSSCTILKIS